MANVLMLIATFLLVASLSVLALTLVITFSVGVYEILTGKYVSQQERILEKIKC